MSSNRQRLGHERHHSGLQDKSIPVKKRQEVELKRKDVEGIVAERAKQTSKDLPAVYTKFRIKKEVDLVEYHGKELQGAQAEVDLTQKVKDIMEVLKVTPPVSEMNKEQEQYRVD